MDNLSISPDQLGDLSQWGLAALLARAALRVLPGELTVGASQKSAASEGSHDEVPAIVRTGLAVLLCARRGRCDGAVASLLQNSLHDSSLPPAGSLAAVARDVALGDLESGAELAADMLRNTEAREQTAEDLELLNEQTSGDIDPPPLPVESFFKRPLWPDAPEQAAEATRSLVSMLSDPLGNVSDADAARLYSMAWDGVSEWDLVERLLNLVAAPAPPRLRMLADEALDSDDDDRLDYATYADALADLINNPETTTPLTLAINAPWGAGKTTLARMVERRLRVNHDHVTCWFNAWLHDEAEDLSGAFAGVVAREANRHRTRWRRLISPVPLPLLSASQRWRRRLWFVCTVILLALVGGLMLPDTDAGKWIAALAPADTGAKAVAGSFFSWFVGLVGFLAGLGKFLNLVSPVAKSLTDFVQNRQKTSNTRSVTEVRDQLSRLIRQGTPPGGRFVIFVDDLERCRPPRPVEVMEVVSLLLAQQNVVTVIVADMPAVAACAEIKYGDLARRYQPSGGTALQTDAASNRRAYGRLYLQKIVQLQFDLPTQPTRGIEGLIRSYVDRKTTAESTADAPGHPSLVGRVSDMLRSVSLRSPREAAIGDLIADAWNQRDYIDGLVLAAAVILLAPFLWSVQTGRRLGYDPGRRSRLTNPTRRDDFVHAANWTFFGPVFVLGFYQYPLRYLLNLVAFNPVALTPNMQKHLDDIAVELAVTTLVLPVLVNALYGFLRCRWDRAVARDLAGEVDKVFRETGDVERARASLQESRFVGKLDLTRLIDERARRYIANDSDLMAQAEAEALMFVPPLPRSAKRFLNRLRLVMTIAYQRGLLSGTAAISPRHIAKWAILQERWPELAQSLGTRPESIDELERDVDGDEYHELLRRLAPSYAIDSDLVRFLGSEPFGGVNLRRLVHYDPHDEAQVT